MAVTLYLAEGTHRTIPEATSANLDESLFRIGRWNRKRRCLDDLELLPADQVAVAEIFENGTRTNVILGKGRISN